MSEIMQFDILAAARDSARDLIGDLEDAKKSQAWFEGYAHGMLKGELITEVEKDYIIEKISEIFHYCWTKKENT